MPEEKKANGLTEAEVRDKFRQFGPNTIGTNKRFVLLKNIVDQFKDFLVIILLIAAGLSFILGDARTTIALLTIVIVNATIGFSQQYKTEKTLMALKSLLPHQSSVIRSGAEKTIPSEYLVPGDIVILQAGDSIPADGVVLEQYSLKVNESSLTGESSPQAKSEAKDPGHDRSNRVFMGTNVLEGEGKIEVTRTGLNTEFGKIAQQTKESQEDLSPLQKKLRQVGAKVAKISLTVMVAILISSIVKQVYFEHADLKMSSFVNVFIFAMAMAAAMVPEGLPATVSVALSIGANRLIKKKAIVKKLASVETLGSTNVICTDKTGTLTVGRMSVVSVWPTEKEECKLKDFANGENAISLNWALCNNVRSSDKGLVGDSDEIAFWEAAERKEIKPAEIIKKYDRLREYSFNPVRKMMSVIANVGGKLTIFAKGNPEVILSHCAINETDKKANLKQIDKLAASGLRVFAFAHKDLGEMPEKSAGADEAEKDLIFDGFCGMADDIHPEVPEAIKYCHRAGIKIVMVTGDYKLTAEATANKINLSGGEEKYRTVSGQELAKMTDLQLRENLLHPIVFYQTDPGEKLRIVKTLQKMGMAVAVTGDGVNDSLALKKADIGVAMGKIGTDVAKEAADMILLDDNFATIIVAVKEGRTIWDNLKKFVYFAFSGNFAELTTIVLSIIFRLPYAMLAVQILFVDALDIIPSVALASERGGKKIESEKNNNLESLLNNNNLTKMIITGFIIGTTAFINYCMVRAGGSGFYEKATTTAFATLILGQVVNVYMCRMRYSSGENLFNRSIIYTVILELAVFCALVYVPLFQTLLSTKPLSLFEWGLAVIGALIFGLIEYVRIRYVFRDRILTKRAILLERA